MALATFPIDSVGIIRRAGFTRGSEVKGIGIQKARNGPEFTIDWGADATRPLSIVTRATEAQADTLEAFHVARRGTWDPFNITIGGVTRKVRFADSKIVGALIEDSDPKLYDYALTFEPVP